MAPATLDHATVLALLRRHGTHSLAYSILQPGLQYFGDTDSGVIAYRRSLGYHIVLGDPVCAAEQAPGLLGPFLDAHPRAVFMQIHGNTARHLAALGMRIVPVGVENDLDPREFTLRGRTKQDLRHYRNKGRAAHLEIAELPDGPKTRQMLDAISTAWLSKVARAGRGELRFLARPLESEAETGVRIFAARHMGNPAGFVLMDPMHRDGHCIGHAAVILRRVPGAPEGILDCINLHALDIFRREGREVFSLGVSPFYNLARHADAAGPLPLPTYGLFRALYRWGTPIYSFRGLSFHKRRYRAREVPVYAALPGPIGLFPAFAAARASRML